MHKNEPERPGLATGAQQCATLQDDDTTIERALEILGRRLRSGAVLSTAQAVKSYLRLQSQGLTHEVFAVFLQIGL